MTSQHPDNGCVVVKRTFIEIVEDGAASPSDVRFQRFRAHSDPGLCDPEEEGEDAPWTTRQRKEEAEQRRGPIAFELMGLSDADTDTEAAPNVPLPCYSHLSNVTPRSDESVCFDTRPDVRAVDALSAASSAGPKAETPVGGQGDGSWQDVAGLLRENARLAFENKLLRENARLASENASLQASYASAEPSEGLQCIAANWMEDAMSVQPMQHQPHPRMPPTVAPGTWLVSMGYHAGPQAMPHDTQLRVAGRAVGMAAVEAMDGSTSRRRRRQAAKSERASDEPAKDNDERTTVMLRNLPNNYTREMLLAMLDGEGFASLYDFIYLPIDFKTQACLGYAFVNLVNPAVVPEFWGKFDGFSSWVLPSKKVCGVTWSGPHQGREAHVDRYRNSPVMHPTVPEAYKPLVFENGQSIPFPLPTKTPRAPRTRNYTCAPGGEERH